MTKIWCVGGRQCSNNNNVTQYEKKNPKTKKPVKIIKRLAVFAVLLNLKFLLIK